MQKMQLFPRMAALYGQIPRCEIRFFRRLKPLLHKICKTTCELSLLAPPQMEQVKVMIQKMIFSCQHKRRFFPQAHPARKQANSPILQPETPQNQIKVTYGREVLIMHHQVFVLLQNQPTKKVKLAGRQPIPEFSRLHSASKKKGAKNGVYHHKIRRRNRRH